LQTAENCKAARGNRAKSRLNFRVFRRARHTTRVLVSAGILQGCFPPVFAIEAGYSLTRILKPDPRSRDASANRHVVTYTPGCARRGVLPFYLFSPAPFPLLVAPDLKLCLRPARSSALRENPLDIKAVEFRYYMSRGKVSSKHGINVSNEILRSLGIVSPY